MKRVIDATIAVKWLAPDPDSPLAECLLDDELIAPDLLFAEVGNISWNRIARPRRLDLRDARPSALSD